LVCASIVKGAPLHGPAYNGFPDVVVRIREVNVGLSPVPNPREVLAVSPDSATHVVPFPTMILLSVGVRAAISSMFPVRDKVMVPAPLVTAI
jgi:hypothetical protein